MRIIVAEDRPEILIGLSKKIRSLVPGAVVLEARDGIPALEMFCEGGADLILTDMSMGLMHGDELIKRVREIDKNVQIFAMSGSAESLKEATQAGANKTYRKPVGLDDSFNADITGVAGVA